MNWDTAISQAINGLVGRSDLLDQAALFLARPVNIVIPALLAFGYWLWCNRREALIGSVSAAGLVGAADFLGAKLKLLVARPRPCHVVDSVNELMGCGGAFGFPSNHALNTAAVAALLQVLYPRSGWMTWPLVALIGVNRVFIGAHYVTDVLGGWAIGALLGVGAGVMLARWPVFRSVP